MHFQVLYDIFSIKCEKNIIDETDRVFYEMYTMKVKIFSISILKKVKTFLTEEQFTFILKEMSKNLLIIPIFEVLCPDCGKVSEKFEAGSIKSTDDLVSCTSYCKSCGEDFTIDSDDIKLRYSIESDFIPV